MAMVVEVFNDPDGLVRKVLVKDKKGLKVIGLTLCNI